MKIEAITRKVLRRREIISASKPNLSYSWTNFLDTNDKGSYAITTLQPEGLRYRVSITHEELRRLVRLWNKTESGERGRYVVGVANGED